jgi:glutaredoxin
MVVFQLPPFRLYGLTGCPHCIEAENFLRERNLPTALIAANDDPIAQAGVQQVLGVAEYPVLCCTLDNSIVRGMNLVEYERLNRLYWTIVGTGLPDGAAGPELPNGEATASSA